MSLSPGVLLMPLTRQMAHFLLHHQVHQRQSDFSHQVPYSLLQSHDLGHPQHHLHCRISSCGELAKLVHRSLLLNLIPSLRLFIATLSFFLPENFLKGYHAFRLRVANFLRIYGHSLENA
jgi:hypothetical protein